MSVSSKENLFLLDRPRQFPLTQASILTELITLNVWVDFIASRMVGLSFTPPR